MIEHVLNEGFRFRGRLTLTSVGHEVTDQILHSLEIPVGQIYI